MFRVPSSTPPSTPGRDPTRSNRPFLSTTPAGPPPDLFNPNPSSTPAGPPPVFPSLFGNSRPSFDRPSQANFDLSAYGSSPPKHGILEGIGEGSIRSSTSGRPGSQRGRTASSLFRLQNSPPRPTEEVESSEDEDEDMASDEDVDAEGEEDEDMDGEGSEEEEEEEEEVFQAQRRPAAQSQLSQSVASRTSATDSVVGPKIVQPGAKQKRYDLLNIAKGLTPSNDRITLHEPDKLILETEELLTTLAESSTSDGPEQRARVLGNVAQDLLRAWQDSVPSASRAVSSSRSGAAAALSNAVKLSDLLINIHHPSPAVNPERLSASAFSLSRVGADSFTPIPKVLLNWLNKHRSAASEIDMVLKEKRGYSKNQYFWDAVHTSVFRGHFDKTMELLQNANFAVAETARADDLGGSGYDGHHRRYAEEAAYAALSVLKDCPAVRADDWDIKGRDWSIFRRHVQQAHSDLAELAEGESVNRHSVSQPFQASHFGISQSQTSFHLSVASRRAESKVPWSVYQNLSKFYQLLLGNEEEIIALATDWIDATLGLAIWWDGEEPETSQSSFAASRRTLARSQRIRTVDVTPAKAYSQRMASALATVFESEEDFTVNISDRFEVGVACILDDNVESVLQILRGSSLMIASAVAEIATAGEWLVRADGILDQFDQSDLMVLSYTEQHRTGVSQDELLVAYSKLLTSKDRVASPDGKTVKEGWELAIRALGRIDDIVLATGRIEKILDQLDLQSADRVDKIIQLCHAIGLSEQAFGIALKYADHLRANTQNYGDTLMYYARAHANAKIQEVLRVLVAHCLVKSMAYPPLSSLDDSLAALVTSPKKTLTQLASLDSEAAQMLSNQLSGYATIRKYYDLRDEEILVQKGQKPAHRPMARKRIAANALMVIIASAASSIRGGLYDPEVETVVHVDVLLPLLGEALVFINQPKRILTLQHLYSLLAAIEDLDTAPSMIRQQCEEALQTTLSAAHSSSTSTFPAPNLQKSTSNLTTASSQFSLINSVEFGSTDAQSTESSAILLSKDGNVDDTKRGWDWRKGFSSGGITGQDLVRILRLGVAREVARAFGEGDVA
ncbi:hypothetical protein DM02DRAFT_667207 [Periconia macrospinosa]|uniref:Nuclear pore complex protein Nup85 n=1 Tax=Periconia macrospinosa TaxID=97972 RepID=A0A2V1EBN4_9PLEO|nr:hypothetical protein DM02DRAFT_667207 [Periconia macrospinosa]